MYKERKNERKKKNNKSSTIYTPRVHNNLLFYIVRTTITIRTARHDTVIIISFTFPRACSDSLTASVKINPSRTPYPGSDNFIARSKQIPFVPIAPYTLAVAHAQWRTRGMEIICIPLFYFFFLWQFRRFTTSYIVIVFQRNTDFQMRAQSTKFKFHKNRTDFCTKER